MDLLKIVFCYPSSSNILETFRSPSLVPRGLAAINSIVYTTIHLFTYMAQPGSLIYGSFLLHLS